MKKRQKREISSSTYDIYDRKVKEKHHRHMIEKKKAYTITFYEDLNRLKTILDRSKRFPTCACIH